MMFLDYIGRASEYPLKVENGSGKVLTGTDTLDASIAQILITPKGTLVANPYFGSELFRILFQPIDAVAISAGRTFIVEALKQWEKRIQITSVTGVAKVEPKVNADGSRSMNSVIYFDIIYKQKGTNVEGSFVFPFYRELEY